jgi:hypothetical protein
MVVLRGFEFQYPWDKRVGERFKRKFSTAGIGAVSRQKKVVGREPAGKPAKCPVKSPVAALKLAQLRPNGETCGERPGHDPIQLNRIMARIFV